MRPHHTIGSVRMKNVFTKGGGLLEGFGVVMFQLDVFVNGACPTRLGPFFPMIRNTVFVCESPTISQGRGSSFPVHHILFPCSGVGYCVAVSQLIPPTSVPNQVMLMLTAFLESLHACLCMQVDGTGWDSTCLLFWTWWRGNL
jgi:hypothetical protein